MMLAAVATGGRQAGGTGVMVVPRTARLKNLPGAVMVVMVVVVVVMEVVVVVVEVLAGGGGVGRRRESPPRLMSKGRLRDEKREIGISENAAVMPEMMSAAGAAV